MAARKRYLVPLDFSRSSEVALNHALGLVRGNKGQLLLVHVLDEPAANVPVPLRDDLYRALEKDAYRAVEKLVKQKKLREGEYRFVLIKGRNPAQGIVEQARKSRVAMIVMGTHGRTGLTRLVLGSVAEKTLRLARCPVLIIKR